jgi:hypothetical protein
MIAIRNDICSLSGLKPDVGRQALPRNWPHDGKTHEITHEESCLFPPWLVNHRSRSRRDAANSDFVVKGRSSTEEGARGYEPGTRLESGRRPRPSSYPQPRSPLSQFEPHSFNVGALNRSPSLGHVMSGNRMCVSQSRSAS